MFISVAPIAQLAEGSALRYRGSRVKIPDWAGRGKSIPSLWREKHPAIQGIWPPASRAPRREISSGQ